MRKVVAFIFLTTIGCASFAQDRLLKINQHVITFQGTKFEINNDGFPKQCSLADNAAEVTSQQLLFEPIHFHFYTAPKVQEKMNVSDFAITAQNADSIVWKANSGSAHLNMYVQGKMLSTGVVRYNVSVKAIKYVELFNVNFHIPFEKSASKYLSGLGVKGGLRPDTVRWQYDNRQKIKPSVWIGNDTLGLYFAIDRQTTLLSSKGGMQINVKGGSMLLDVYTNQISLKENEQLSFSFDLIVTPQLATEKKIPVKKKLKFYHRLIKEN